MNKEKGVNPAYAGKTPVELKTIARLAYGEAKKAKNPLEILGYLQVSSEALTAGNCTIESVDMDMEKIIRVASRAYGNLSSETTAVHAIADNILSSFPRAKSA
jgi:hypothetical protein